MTTPTPLKSDEALRALAQIEDRLLFGSLERPGSPDPLVVSHGPAWALLEIPSKTLAVRFAFDTGEDLLHSFDLPGKKSLLRKAYDALPVGGELVVIELILDNERRQNTMGLLLSLNMLIESDGGFNFTQADFEGWAKEAGFREIRFELLAGPTSAAIALK